MSLAERILEILEHSPGKKAMEMARALGVDKKEVNSCLYGKLRGKVWQDKSYRWYPSGKSSGQGQPAAPKTKLNTPLSRLCRYYLDCMSRDEDQGVSVFAASKYGDPDYVELRNESLLGVENYFEQPDASRLLGAFKREKKRLALYVGYPVRLRKHVAKSGWEGFFVEPIFLMPFEVESDYGTPTLSTDLPVLNFKAINNLTAGGAGNLIEEVITLSDELGLNNPQEDLPDVDEVFPRIQQLRPEWGWAENVDPDALTAGSSLAEISEEGIYNRAVLLYGERSPYTQGLENELKKLSETVDGQIGQTALGSWADKDQPVLNPTEPLPLLEVLPMNVEQREAIQRSLAEPLTVITGPPGTGKSQVVTNLLINAAWRGQRVLFASKNNKAVDVVETRVNELGSRPILLRMGSNEYQVKLAEYLIQLLSAKTTQTNRADYEESLSVHERLIEKFKALNEQMEKTLAARNKVDELEQQVESLREKMGAGLFRSSKSIDLTRVRTEASRYEESLNLCVRNKQPLLTRFFWGLVKKERFQSLEQTEKEFANSISQIGMKTPSVRIDDASVSGRVSNFAKIRSRTTDVEKVQTYFNSLNYLSKQPSFEVLAQKHMDLMAEIASNSEILWQNWIKLQPSRLTQKDRGTLNDYATVLKVMVSARDEKKKVDGRIYRKYIELFPKVSHMLPCWAVTSLSAHNKVPFEPGYFDLLVIDEASQCDIASALPLLYRSKRVVVIGDPKQLSHISRISMSQDKQLMDKHEVIEDFMAWSYSTNSLFDLAVGLARPEDIVDLKDHHRSHAQIIGFSNAHFYESNLRVATRYDRLRLLKDGKPAVRWQHHAGTVTRPTSGGAVNSSEAHEVIKWLRDLLLNRSYVGTVGVVTPFRAQANIIRELAYKDEELAQALMKADFLVDTVHKFQGDERDVMVFSPVVAKGISQVSLSFLKKTGNLFNVAITRARALLCVVGDQAAAMESGVDYLSSFANYVSQLKEEQKAKEEFDNSDLGPEYPAVSNPHQVSDWERLFYKALYRAGVRPIPQFSEEQYVLDFAVFDGTRKLNLEVDGERYHRSWTGELCRRDQLRNQRMIELGWEVKRFWVYQIRDELDQCVAWVKNWIEEGHQKRRTG